MLQIEQQDPDRIPDAVLRAMFAARKAVFVDLLRWDVPVLDGQFEIDQFDTPLATYLVLTDNTGAHLGSARLLPTTQPHILDSLYAGLCADPPPRGPAIFEITRFCLDRRLRAPERRLVRDALVVALVDHARATGIERYTAIAELGWFQQILAFGWRCLPLGMPQNYDGSMLAALEIVITPDTARQLMTATAPSDVLDWAKRLLTEGWCIIPAAMPPSVIAQIDADLEPAFAVTPFGTGAFYGETTQRFGRLLTRSAHSPRLVQHALIQAIAEQILSPWCDCIQLNVMQAIGVHPGAPAQAPHRDHDMWAGPVGEIEYLVNVLWPLTPFRSDNGATTLWSHSHGKAAREDTPPDIPVAAEMVPGDALMFLGSTLHAAGANRSDAVRRAIVVGYALGWLKPYENPWLAYPPAVARRFDPALAALVGYRQHRPNLGNFEGQCPSVLLGTRVPGVLGAIDALRPDQQAMVEAFAASQLPAP